MEIEKQLEKIGLSKNESLIYLFLLKKGETTTGSIIKETGIANSRVYESLNSLVTKGLVSYSVRKNGKYFMAVDPERIMERENERKQMISSLIPQLQQMQSKKEAGTATAIYEGFEGFKTAFKKIIDDCPEKETIHIFGFSIPEFAEESLRVFISNMNLKSKQKKQKLMIILDRSAKETLGKDREKEAYTETRYLPRGYSNPAAFDIFQDYVYIFLWEEKPFVFMIKNRTIAESYKQHFNFLWNISKK